MPIPLIPVIAALAAGGTLVPHAAGGLIVTAATGGYVAGTYLSTAAVAAIMATLGGGAAVVTGAASTIIGGAGLFGTTIGSSGITGILMTAGILPATPVAVPVIVGGLLLSSGYGSFVIFKLRRKIQAAQDGQEVHFTATEARIIEALIKLFKKRKGSQI